MKATITFPGNYRGRANTLYDYQRKLDARLSVPKKRVDNVKKSYNLKY